MLGSRARQDGVVGSGVVDAPDVRSILLAVYGSHLASFYPELAPLKRDFGTGLACAPVTEHSEGAIPRPAVKGGDPAVRSSHIAALVLIEPMTKGKGSA